jgi:hypothetical protein
VLEDLAALPDDAPVLADGPHLLPELVRGHALFVVASPQLQRDLVTRRGSDLYARTRDPDRRSQIGDVSETARAVDAGFLAVIADWIARPDHGDVAACRRYDEGARLRQRQAHAAATARRD